MNYCVIIGKRILFFGLSKAVDEGACTRSETGSSPSFSIAFRGATTSLQGKWLSLAGRGLPFSRFIQAVFRCPAYKYSNGGVFWLGKEKNSHFDEDSGTDAE